MKDSQDWLKKAQTLSTGSKARIEHDCGSGTALVVNNQPKGYSCYCHRCGFKDWVWKGPRTFAELMDQRKRDLEDAASIRGNTTLPSDFTLDIPPEALLWLLKGNVTPYIAKHHKIGWSKRYERVVLPVYNKNNLVYYQMRAIHKHQTIKYINPSVDRSKILYWVTPQDADKSVIVIVEDMLSAIRVGKHIPTVSALGTKLSEAHLGLLSEYKLVVTWLDADEAGITGAYKMRKALNLATSTKNIYTSKDPKHLTNKQIRGELKCVQ